MTSPPAEPSQLQLGVDAPHVDKEAGSTSKATPTSPSSSPTPNQTSESPADAFGDHSSSYWPPTWNFDRYVKATGLELHTLPDDQFPKLQAGLLDVLGAEGVSRLNDYLHKSARQRAGIQPSYPDWLKYLREFHADQTWGFVAIQTTCFDDPERWAEFKAKFDQIIWASSLHATGATTAPDLAQAKAKFEIQWIEDPTIDWDRDGQGPTLEELREHFKQAISGEHSLPNAIHKQIFLVITEGSIASAMDASIPAIARFHDPDTAQSTKAKRRGPDGIIDPPFVLAVAADEPPPLGEDEDGHGWFKAIFKVSVELLATDFWHELDLQMNRNGEPLMKITRFTKGVDSRGQELAGSAGDGNAEEQDVWWGTSVPLSNSAKRRRVI